MALCCNHTPMSALWPYSRRGRRCVCIIWTWLGTCANLRTLPVLPEKRRRLIVPPSTRPGMVLGCSSVPSCRLRPQKKFSGPVSRYCTGSNARILDAATQHGRCSIRYVLCVPLSFVPTDMSLYIENICKIRDHPRVYPVYL